MRRIWCQTWSGDAREDLRAGCPRMGRRDSSGTVSLRSTLVAAGGGEMPQLTR